MTLSSLFHNYKLQQIDFLKMDCEGAEYQVILDSSPELLSKINVISLEFHDLKIAEYTGNKLSNHLIKCGFKIEKFIYLPSNINLNYGKIIAVNTAFKSLKNSKMHE